MDKNKTKSRQSRRRCRAGEKVQNKYSLPKVAQNQIAEEMYVFALNVLNLSPAEARTVKVITRSTLRD